MSALPGYFRHQLVSLLPNQRPPWCVEANASQIVPGTPPLPIQSETRRAYWRVVMLVSGPRRPVNKNSPGLLLAAGFLLSDRCAIRRVSTRGDILYPDGD